MASSNSSSIQFFGIESVIAAYEARNVAAFAIWQGKQFQFPCVPDSVEDGSVELQAILERLAKSTNAIYTLKVYEDVPTGGKIKSNTPDDGSFNFRLNADEQLITQSQYASYRKTEEIHTRLAAIEQKLNVEEDDEDEPENKLGLIGEIIGHPAIQPIVQELFLSVISSFKKPAQPPAMQTARISGIDEDKMLQDAIKALQQHDVKLSEHLMKLAKLAQESPASFNFLIQTLDGM
jgi:hypothetical protein